MVKQVNNGKKVPGENPIVLKCTTNNCKPSQNFDYQKTELSLKFIWFEKFPCVWLFSLDERMEPIACLLFYLIIKMEVLNIFAKSHIKHDRQQ